MREILFRGKRVDNGEWETGGILAPTAPNILIMQQYVRTAIITKGKIMRKTIKKFKYWLIQKLGGYTELQQTHSVKIIREMVPTVTIGVETSYNPKLLNEDPLYQEAIFSDLANLLTQKILTNRFFTVETSGDATEDLIRGRMRARMCIILPKTEANENIPL